MSLFGKKPEGQTVLLLDVEQGSVGAGLARVERGVQPRLFGEARERLPLLSTQDSAALARQTLKAAEVALAHASEVAARMRMSRAAPLGTVRHAALFLSAPWGVPDLSAGKPRFVEHLRAELINAASAYFGNLTFSTHTNADAAALAAHAHAQAPLFLVILRGELIELLSLAEGGARGYATIPGGLNLVARTLHTHAGLSHAEALSRLTLPYEAQHSFEPLGAVREQLLSELRRAAPQLSPAQGARIIVIAEDGRGSWLARTLAQDDDFAELFDAQSAVEALSPRHLMPFVAAHAQSPDLFLLAQTLFLDAKINHV